MHFSLTFGQPLVALRVKTVLGVERRAVSVRQLSFLLLLYLAVSVIMLLSVLLCVEYFVLLR